MQRLGLCALGLAAAPSVAAVQAGMERHRRVLQPPQPDQTFSDLSMRGSLGADAAARAPPSAGKADAAPSWWLPPASAYMAAGIPAASLGVYGNAASMPTVAGTYTPYAGAYPSAGFPDAGAGYPYYGYMPSAPFAAVAGTPSGYTNVYSMLSGAYRFRAGGGEEGGAAAGGGLPPRFAQADLASEEGAASAEAAAQRAYHAHAAGVLSDAAAAAAEHGFAHPQWVDFARPESHSGGMPGASSAYSAAQRAHVMRMMEQEKGMAGTQQQAAAGGEAEAEGEGEEALEVVKPVAAAAETEGRGHVTGATLSRAAIDEEMKALEALAANI